MYRRGKIDPDYQGEIGLLLLNGDNKEYVWNSGDLLKHLLALSCPVIKVKGKLQNPILAGLIMVQTLQE